MTSILQSNLPGLVPVPWVNSNPQPVGDPGPPPNGPLLAKIPIKRVSGNYGFIPADRGTRVESIDGTAQTFTVTPGLGAEGDVIEVAAMGAGLLTMADAGGATLNVPEGFAGTFAQYTTGGVICEGSDVWTLSGMFQ